MQITLSDSNGSSEAKSGADDLENLSLLARDILLTGTRQQFPSLTPCPFFETRAATEAERDSGVRGLEYKLMIARQGQYLLSEQPSDHRKRTETRNDDTKVDRTISMGDE